MQFSSPTGKPLSLPTTRLSPAPASSRVPFARAADNGDDMVYYECNSCKQTITRRRSQGAPSMTDGGKCPKNSFSGCHYWSGPK